jgi:UDP-glucose 4-epimerase
MTTGFSAPRVYVFGGAGFLGKAFCRAWPEAVPCDSETRLGLAGVDGVEFDFGADGPDGLPCAKGDAAVIFSWRGYPAAHDADPVGKLSLNLSCTLELVSWLARRGVAKILYASTGGAIYGNAGRSAVDESKAIAPVGFYGIGKATAEMYVGKICRTSSVSHAIFRIGNAYGADQIRDNLSVGFPAKAVAAALEGKKLEIWGDGSIRRDYIHADDVADAFCRVLRSQDIPSGVYNLGAGESFSNLEIVEVVERVSRQKLNISFGEARSFDVQDICLDSSKLRKAADWRPRISLEEGVRRLIHAEQERFRAA